MIARKILQNQNVICASPEYLANSKPITSPKDLQLHRIIEDTNLKNREVWRFDCCGSYHDANVTPSLVVNSAHAVKTAIINGLGVGMMPRGFAKSSIEDGSMIELLPQYILQQRTVYALYPERVNTPHKVKQFIEEICEYFSEN